MHLGTFLRPVRLLDCGLRLCTQTILKTANALPIYMPCLCRKDPEDTAIVDGQHRVAALMIMSEAGAWDKVKFFH